MKHILSIFLTTQFCSFTFLAICQKDAIKKDAGPYIFSASESIPMSGDHRSANTFAFPDGFLQINNKKVESFNFQWLNQDLKLIKDNTVDVKSQFATKVDLEGFFRTKNKMFALIREFLDASQGVYVLEINPQKMTIDGKAKNLFTFSDRTIMSVTDNLSNDNRDQNGIGNFGLYLSKDSSKFMLCYRGWEKDKKKIAIQVFDESLTPLYNGEFDLPYGDNRREAVKILLGNDSKVYVLSKVFDNENVHQYLRKEKDTYHYEVFVYSKGEPSPKIVMTNFGQLFMKDAFLIEDNQKNILVAGLCGKSEKNILTGVSLTKINFEKLKTEPYNGGDYYEFPVDFLKRYLKTEDVQKLFLKNLIIKDLHFCQDGSMRMINEFYEFSLDPEGRLFELGDLIIIKLNNNKMEWMKNISKQQKYASTSRLSFNTLFIGNDIHIFFRDLEKNMNLEEGNNIKKFDGRLGFIKGFEINGSGEIKQYNIIDTDPFDRHLEIRYFNKAGNYIFKNENKGRETKLFKISVKK